jgi:uncharacterized protein (DUF885 family)
MQDKRGRLTNTVVNGQKALYVSLSDSEVAQAKERAALALTAVRSIKEDDLPPTAKVDWRMLLHLTKSDVDLAKFPTEYFAPYRRDYWYPADNNAATWRFSDLPHGSPAEYEQILARLRGIPLRLAELKQTLDAGLAHGVITPQTDVQAFLRVLRADVTPDPLASRFLTAFRQYPSSMSADQQNAFTQEASEIYRTAIQPAYADMTRYVEQIYLPASRSFVPMTALPNGVAWYGAQIRAQTGIDVSPEEIHRTALAEVHRIQGELETLARSTGFNGTYNEFILAMRDDLRCAPLDAEAIRTRFQALMRQVEKGLPRVFGLIPKTPYEIVPDATGSGSGELRRGFSQEGSLKLGRPGRVLVHAPYESSCDFVTVMLHEAVPGHLFEMHVTAEYANISELRRQNFLWNGRSFSEGWATYAQDLTAELGFAPDAQIRAWSLGGRLFMAARTVVDTGLHAMGWSREKAIEYYRTTVAWDQPELASGIIDGVAFQPGQYLVYFVGQQKIAALRAQAEKELGPRFDLRGFHDEILRNGPLPFDVLDAQVGDWMSVQRRNR